MRIDERWHQVNQIKKRLDAGEDMPMRAAIENLVSLLHETREAHDRDGAALTQLFREREQLEEKLYELRERDIKLGEAYDRGYATGSVATCLSAERLSQANTPESTQLADAYRRGYVDGQRNNAYDFQSMVKELHIALDHPAPDCPTLDNYRFELRARLILEEALEFIAASGFWVKVGGSYPGGQMYIQPHLIRTPELIPDGYKPDWPAMIDALCDLLYVTYGAAIEAGVPLLPFFREVHRANMTKVGGPVRGDGKGLKPEGWKPPRIAELLAELLLQSAPAGEIVDTDSDNGDET